MREARLWAWTRGLGVVVILVAVALIAADNAAEQRVGTDFHVFWQAGYDFAHGLPLYQPLEGARRFIYPPFAAQVFQLLGVFPLRTAAWIFYVLSVALVLVAVRISRDIAKRGAISRPTYGRPLLLALLFSAVFIVDNLDHVQVNMVTFVLCLLGVQAYVRGREWTASGWIVAASAIKLTPAFFAGWLVLRGTRRSLVAVASFAGLCLVLPILQRGVNQGLTDLATYHQSFLQQFAAGKVITNPRNQNLAAMVYRAVAPVGARETPPYDYTYLPSLQASAPLLYRVTAVAVLGAFLVHVIRLRATRRPVGALEISSVFLVSHLLSGITWKAHLVTLLFVFYAFFSLDAGAMPRSGRLLLALAWVAIGIIGLGRDLVGSQVYDSLAGYSVYVWVMLLLFGLSVAWSQQRTSEVRSEK